MDLSPTAVRQQRADIAKAQRRVRKLLQGTSHKIRREFRIVPYVALEIDAEGLALLEAAGLDVESIYEDRVATASLAESIPQIEGDVALQSGLNGSGSVVAIVDSGVDKAHPFLAGKVINEACYALSESGIGGDCPNGQATQVTDGAGVPCTFASNSCRHGTHVAGIAAGSGSNFSGVAPGASLIAIQVFHSSTICGAFEGTPCARAYGSDIVAALERVYELRDQYPIASVNLSLGAGAASSNCDADFPEFLDVMDNLKAAGIATVVASGNGGYADAISWPACISTAVSVGAVDENDSVASFSNVSQDLDLFAPGTAIDSSVPGGGFASFNGTSMAAPHVAGAWAVLEQANPAATVDDNLGLLEITGRPVIDFRGVSNITKPRIRLSGAAGIENPLPVLTSIVPTSVSAWGSAATLTVTGSDFARSSVVIVDGVAVPTTYVSDTELITTLTASDLATAATSLDISVFSPPLGGGTSASISLNVQQPSLTVSATSVGAGGTVTVTLVDGPGNSSEWLALAGVGDPDTSYLQWVNVSPGATTASWTAIMPTTPGDYEFRLFGNGNFTRMATSPTVTVEEAPPDPEPPTDPPSSAVLDVSATAVNGGDSVTVTLSDGPGNSGDWLALARVGDPVTSYLQWIYVGAGATTATWTVTMPATLGDYEFRLFENGGFKIIGTSATVTVGSTPSEPPPDPPDPPPPAILDVSTTTANGGDAVTVTLSDGPGNSNDWLALAGVGDPDTSYLQWTYVGAGATSATWTVIMPSTPGDYEFRLFENGGYTRIATSPTVTVGSTPPEPPPDPPDPPPPAVLDVSATAVYGGDAVTVTLSDGPGNSNDWLALAGVGDPDTTYLQWIYVGAGATTATWTVTMPATPGDYEFRLFENGGYTRIGTSPTVTVEAAPPEPPPEPPPDPPPPAVLDVSATAVNGGDSVTVTLSDGPGNGSDWLALAGVGDPDTTYLQWIYVGAGATTATWTVTMPATPGDYEFRLFENGGYTRIATSPTVTVGSDPSEPPPDPPPPPVLDVDTTAVNGGDSVAVTLSDGPGNGSDWLALAGVGDPDTTYLQWRYVGTGVTTTTWTVTMPATPGDYEFRLFENGGYTRIATSPTVVVGP
jgi:subtilisin family serine protease